jgi:Flp pilus assembly protein TadB
MAVPGILTPILLGLRLGPQSYQGKGAVMTIRFQYKRGGWFQFLATMLGVAVAFVVAIIFLANGLIKHSTGYIVFGIICMILAIWVVVGMRRAGKRDGVDYLRPWKS